MLNSETSSIFTKGLHLSSRRVAMVAIGTHFYDIFRAVTHCRDEALNRVGSATRFVSDPFFDNRLVREECIHQRDSDPAENHYWLPILNSKRSGDRSQLLVEAVTTVEIGLVMLVDR